MSRVGVAIIVLAVCATAWWALRPAPLPDQQIPTSFSFSFDHRLCDGGCYFGDWTPEACASLPYWGEHELEKCMAAAARFKEKQTP